MNIISALAVLACSCSAAQLVMRGSAGKQGAYSFSYETRIEPEIRGQTLRGFDGGGLIATSGSVHRWIRDAENRTYFGYDLSIEPESGGKLKLTFLPLSVPAEKLRLTPEGAWTQIPLPRLPPPQTIRTTDTVAVDLFVHPATGQRVVDYLHFDDKPSRVMLIGAALRDFTVEDVPLSFTNTRLSLNGKQIQALGGTVIGPVVYFYLPGRGRYLLSLAHREDRGFRRAGEVRGNKIMVTVDGDVLVIDTDGPIAPGGGTYHVFLYVDKSWKPDNPDAFQFGTLPRR